MKSLARSARAALLGALAALWAGCQALPSQRLRECHQRCQVVQAELAQHKDETLRLRTRNQELAQRAVDDERRVRVAEDARAKLEASLLAYQRERDQMREAFDGLQRQIRSAALEPPTRAAANRDPAVSAVSSRVPD